MLKLTAARRLLAATAMSALGIGLLTGMAEARTNHAVLVAVTAYPNLPPRASLVGPNHDAVLVRDYLTTAAPVKFEPANVAVLADGVEGAAASPTREQILATLRTLAEKAERDDFVYLHFSGHGAQQPETKAGSETDGLDEIFLPADTDKWADQTKGVPNALQDDEIGAALDAIRDKGAFVWVIFDACHSGSATRAAPIGEDEMTERKLDFETLGIPAEAMAAAEDASDAVSGTRGVGAGEQEEERQAAFTLGVTPTGAEPTAKGGMVAFFAAQTIETTPEMPLPKGVEGAPKYGLFTFTLFSKLAENPNMTYRQLGHAVLQQYSADARQRPTPLFEGELDAPVFGSTGGERLMQWPLEIKGSSASLSAGLLHRLSPGTRLAIVPSPQSDLTDALGYVEVKSAKNLTSQVVPVAAEGMPALKLAEMPANAYARVAQIAVDFKLKVARPAATAGLGRPVELVNKLLDVLAAKKDKPFNIELVAPGEAADIRLAVLPENAVAGAADGASEQPAIFFLPPSGDISLKDGNRPPLVRLGPDFLKVAEGTSDNLTRIFRATSLSRLAAASDYRPDQVSVEFKIKREEADELQPLQEATVPVVNPGDQVHILAKNNSTKIVDINILYIGSDYSITHIDAQRLVPGATIEEGLLAFTDASFGMERMVAVLTEAPPQSEIEDLSFLEQGGVPATRSASVGGDRGFMGMIEDIAGAPSTRAAMKLSDSGGSKGAVLIFPMETEPRR